MEKLRENSRSDSAKFRADTPRKLGVIKKKKEKKKSLNFCLFDLWFYVPVNNYGRVETVIFTLRGVGRSNSFFKSLIEIPMNTHCRP